MTSPLPVDQLISQVGESLQNGYLPQRIFNDPDIHRLELERIFGGSWLYVGHETEIPNTGDYARRYIGEDPFIFARDMDGGIQVLFDSCRHKGTKLCRAEQGNTSHFRCPYHGWTYKTSGELVGVPFSEQAFDGIDKSEYGLHKAPRVDTYEGLVFASLAEEGPSLEEHIGPFTWYLDIHLKLSEGGMEVLGEPQRVDVNVNWKIGVDNFYGDSYHTPVTHRSVLETDIATEETAGAPKEYQFELSQCGTSGGTIRLLEGEEHGFWNYPEEVVQYFSSDRLSETQFRHAKLSALHVFSIFPNLSFIHHAVRDAAGEPLTAYMSIRQWQPTGPESLQLWNWILVPAEASEEYKERARRVATATFSPSGNFEQDDLAVWDGITESSGSTFAKLHDTKLLYRMGWEFGEGQPVDGHTDAPLGPGILLDSNLGDGSARTFHTCWYEEMSGEELPDDRPPRSFPEKGNSKDRD